MPTAVSSVFPRTMLSALFAGLHIPEISLDLQAIGAHVSESPRRRIMCPSVLFRPLSVPPIEASAWTSSDKFTSGSSFVYMISGGVFISCFIGSCSSLILSRRLGHGGTLDGSCVRKTRSGLIRF